MLSLSGGQPAYCGVRQTSKPLGERMSKKVKRQVNRPASERPAGRSTAEFNPDYSHVKKDLTRIGILAGTFFVLLIIVSIFQDQLLALFVK